MQIRHWLSRSVVPIALIGAALLAPTTASAATAPLIVGTHSSSAGTVLAAPNGLTLYTLAGDTATHSNCTGGCASAWPPLTLVAGQVAQGATGVGGTFAALTRTDGSRQVVYNGKPLYGWQGDAKPGDVTGNGIAGFSVAKPTAATGKPPATSISAAGRVGSSKTGTFVSGKTLVVKKGATITLRFHLGTAFTGKAVTILVATKTSSTASWSSFKRLTGVRVDATGYVYVFVHVTGWEAFRATYAGDTTHGPGTSSSVIAHGV